MLYHLEGSANKAHLPPRTAAPSVATPKDCGPTGGCLALTMARSQSLSLPPTVKICQRTHRAAATHEGSSRTMPETSGEFNPFPP